MSYDRRKVRVGRVVSDKMDRTVVVQVEWRSTHRLYKKPIRRRTKLKVHDPENISMVGDLVQVMESRPRSKTKRWRLVEVLQRSDLVDVLPDEIDDVTMVVEPEREPVLEQPEMGTPPEDEAAVAAGVAVDMATVVEEAEEDRAEAEPAAEGAATAEAETAEAESEEVRAETEPAAEGAAAAEAETAEAESEEARAETEPAAEDTAIAETKAEITAEEAEDVRPEAEIAAEEATTETPAQNADEAQSEAEATIQDATEAQTETETKAEDAPNAAERGRESP